MQGKDSVSASKMAAGFNLVEGQQSVITLAVGIAAHLTRVRHVISMVVVTEVQALRLVALAVADIVLVVVSVVAAVPVAAVADAVPAVEVADAVPVVEVEAIQAEGVGNNQNR